MERAAGVRGRPAAREGAWSARLSARYLATGAMALLSIFWLLPVVWVLVTSLKRTRDIVQLPPQWTPTPATLEHYGAVFSGARTASIGRAFFNSTVVALATVALLVLISALAAYPLARMRFPGRD